MPRKTRTGDMEGRRQSRASMRPRPDAAENPPARDRRVEAVGASMRPRPDAAENRLKRPLRCNGLVGFNEAAARCRGKRPRPAGSAGRPRRFNEAAARCRGKQGYGRGTGSDTQDRFNEAAARCRGKRRATPRAPTAARGFNEAAARCRGKRAALGHQPRPHEASMRPRPDAAENADLRGVIAARLPELQ